GAAAGAEGAAAAKAPAPPSPEEDPNFQAVKARAEKAAKKSAAHGGAGDLATNAKDAAEPKATGEVLGEAQTKQLEQIKQVKPLEFNKDRFIKEVFDEVERTAPKTVQDAKNFDANNKGVEIQNKARGETQSEVDRTRDPLKKETEAAPNTGGVTPRTPSELKPESVGAPPADINAGQAVPPRRPESEVEAPLAQSKQQ